VELRINFTLTRIGLALPTNNRLGWRNLKVANTSAYYTTELVTIVKRYTVQYHGVCTINYLTIVLYSKLACLLPSIIFNLAWYSCARIEPNLTANMILQ
jgi:hypothetical protein